MHPLASASHPIPSQLSSLQFILCCSIRNPVIFLHGCANANVLRPASMCRGPQPDLIWAGRLRQHLWLRQPLEWDPGAGPHQQNKGKGTLAHAYVFTVFAKPFKHPKTAK
eukprot:scaffold135417_cov25-Prasinocladus_malaysianus.AAC.1